MQKIHLKFADKFRSHWIKVTFYRDKPDTQKSMIPGRIAFCEALKSAVTRPVLLDKNNCACPGARYAFGWDSDKTSFLRDCHKKSGIPMTRLKMMSANISPCDTAVRYIGFNTDDTPDVLISYTSPREIMNIIELYQQSTGNEVPITCSRMLSVCGTVALRSYRDQHITLSFGSETARDYGGLARDAIAVGIPKKYFTLFVA